MIHRNTPMPLYNIIKIGRSYCLILACVFVCLHTSCFWDDIHRKRCSSFGRSDYICQTGMREQHRNDIQNSFRKSLNLTIYTYCLCIHSIFVQYKVSLTSPEKSYSSSKLMTSLTPCRLISSSQIDGGWRCTVLFLAIAIYKHNHIISASPRGMCSCLSVNISRWLYLLHGGTKDAVALVIRNLHWTQELHSETFHPSRVPLHCYGNTHEQTLLTKRLFEKEINCEGQRRKTRKWSCVTCLTYLDHFSYSIEILLLDKIKVCILQMKPSSYVDAVNNNSVHWFSYSSDLSSDRRPHGRNTPGKSLSLPCACCTHGTSNRPPLPRRKADHQHLAPAHLHGVGWTCGVGVCIVCIILSKQSILCFKIDERNS